MVVVGSGVGEGGRKGPGWEGHVQGPFQAHSGGVLFAVDAKACDPATLFTRESSHSPAESRMTRVYVVGLDVTHKCQITRHELDALHGVGKHGSFLAAISRFYLKYHK